MSECAVWPPGVPCAGQLLASRVCSLNRQVFPLFSLSYTHGNPDVRDGREHVVCVGAEWVLFEVKLFQAGAGLQSVDGHICDKVFVGVDVRERWNLQQDVGQADERV